MPTLQASSIPTRTATATDINVAELLRRVPSRKLSSRARLVLRLRRTNESRDLLLAIAATLVSDEPYHARYAVILVIRRPHTNFALRSSCFAEDDSK
jgi:hypothetical protein